MVTRWSRGGHEVVTGWSRGGHGVVTGATQAKGGDAGKEGGTGGAGEAAWTCTEVPPASSPHPHQG